MNTLFFRRGPKKQNAVLTILELSRRPFERFRRKQQLAQGSEPPKPKSKAGPTHPEVRLSPGGYHPRTENTSLIDRTTVLRLLVARHFGIPAEEILPVLVLSSTQASRQSLLALAAAIDLEFGVYVEPESFSPEFTFGKLAEMTLRSSAQ